MRAGQSCPRQCAIVLVRLAAFVSFCRIRRSGSIVFAVIGKRCHNSETFADRAGSWPGQRLRHQKKQTGGPTRLRGAVRSPLADADGDRRSGNRRVEVSDPGCASCFPVCDAIVEGESGSSWGEATWRTGRDLLLRVSCRYFAFLMSGLTDARAADPGFCRQYAKAAISQVRGALADPSLRRRRAGRPLVNGFCGSL